MTLVDLFCGAGGLSLGLRTAGFDAVYAADWDRWACETYRNNLGEHVHQVDLASAKPAAYAAEILEEAGASSIDLVAGGPPCQGFSVQRRGAPDDPRNGLATQFARIAVALRPRAIMMENVPTILGARGKTHLEKVYQVFRRAGYTPSAEVMEAAEYGVPQMRRRAFVVALRNDLDAGFLFPEPLRSSEEFATVRDAIGDLPEPPVDFSEHPDFPNHRRVKTSEINLRRLSHVPEGGGRLDIPEELQLPCHRNDNGHRHLDVYGRLWWNRPSGTITAMFDNFTRGRFAHPSQNRSITGREGARLQSFPDSYVFAGPKKDVARQIGNAVAPRVAEVMGICLAGSLRGEIPGSEELRQGFLPMFPQ